MSLTLTQALWSYRGFIFGSVKREFQSRYRKSLLGAAWTVLQPLAMITVYAVVFSELMRARLPGIDNGHAYSIFLCAGLLTWGLFADILQRGQNVFLDNGNLIKKLNFPRICLPVIAIINALINFSITFILFLLFLLIARSFPGMVALYTLPVLMIQVAMAAGIGTIAGVLNVFFRDVGQFMNILLQFWFWFTPIVYSAATLPSWARTWVAFNPATALAEAYQAIYVYDRVPDWNGLWPVALFAGVMCCLASILFRRHASDMVDEL